MPDNPRLLTVAIPCYNGAATLGPTLRSLLSQDGSPFRIIVCDDRSDDDSLRIVREIGGDRVEILPNSERLGLAGNWNRCAEVATSPFVAIFHQDDLMGPGHIASHEAMIAGNPDLGWIASGSGVIDENGRDVPDTIVGRGGFGPFDRVFAEGEAIASMIVENPLRCSAVTTSVVAHREVGGFDPSYRYVVDWEFWLRVARRHRVAWLARPSVDVRWHSASETHRFATGTADLDETARLLDSMGDEARSMRPRANRKLSRAYLNRAHVALKAGNAGLARTALRQSLRLWPGIVGRIVTDPRLAVQMAALGIAPRWAARVFARSAIEDATTIAQPPSRGRPSP